MFRHSTESHVPKHVQSLCVHAENNECLMVQPNCSSSAMPPKLCIALPYIINQTLWYSGIQSLCTDSKKLQHIKYHKYASEHAIK